MNKPDHLPLVALAATAVAAATLPPTTAQAACVTYLAASTPPVAVNLCELYGCAANGSLPSIAMGLNRLQAQAVSDGDGGTVSAQSVAPAQSSANIACLSDAYGAPIAAQGLHQTRQHLDQVLARLTPSRTPSADKTSRAQGWSLYTLGGDSARREDTRDGESGASTLRVHRVDLTVGTDYRLNDQWVAGASLGIGNPRMRWSGNPVRVDGRSANLTAYGSWSPTATSYVSAALSVERSRYTLSSDDGIDSTRDDTRAHQTGLSLQAGRDFNTGLWTVSPYLRADQIASRVGNFGSEASGNKGRSGSLSAGSQLQFSVPTSWGLFAPHARLELTRLTQWKLSGDSSATYAASAGILPSPNPVEIDRQFGQVGVGASALFQRGVTVFTDCDTGFAQKGVNSWRFTLGLRAEL